MHTCLLYAPVVLLPAKHGGRVCACVCLCTLRLMYPVRIETRDDGRSDYRFHAKPRKRTFSTDFGHLCSEYTVCGCCVYLLCIFTSSSPVVYTNREKEAFPRNLHNYPPPRSKTSNIPQENENPPPVSHAPCSPLYSTTYYAHSSLCSNQYVFHHSCPPVPCFFSPRDEASKLHDASCKTELISNHRHETPCQLMPRMYHAVRMYFALGPSAAETAIRWKGTKASAGTGILHTGWSTCMMEYL